MKVYGFLVIAALTLVASCRNGADDNGGKAVNYVATDARTMGLLGEVKEVKVAAIFGLDEKGEEVTDGYQLQAIFDENGRVLLDNWGNKYEYDAEGNFIKGSSDIAKVTRDEQGRLVGYHNMTTDYTQAIDYDHYISLDLSYDEKGRVLREEVGRWESGNTNTYVYEGDNIYPQRNYFVGGETITVTKGTSVYKYTSFDKKGNWIEREVITEAVSTSEGDEENPDAYKLEYTEKRVIVYW